MVSHTDSSKSQDFYFFCPFWFHENSKKLYCFNRNSVRIDFGMIVIICYVRFFVSKEDVLDDWCRKNKVSILFIQWVFFVSHLVISLKLALFFSSPGQRPCKLCDWRINIGLTAIVDTNFCVHGEFNCASKTNRHLLELKLR